MLDATHVATFGGMFSAGQVLGQFGIQWMAEWTGRKGAAWTFMALLLVVSARYASPTLANSSPSQLKSLASNGGTLPLPKPSPVSVSELPKPFCLS